MTEETDSRDYAMSVADGSYQWYVIASKRSRRAHRISEVAAVALSAGVPLAAVLAPGVPAITAALGSLLVLIAGVRATYKWFENYLRFSRAREAVEEQRRLYRVAAPPYEVPATRDAELVKAVTRIERDEIGQWAQTPANQIDAPRSAQ